MTRSRRSINAMSFKNHINCAWVNERLDSYLDGDLSPEETLSFEQHSNDCPTCAGELLLARDVISELHAFPTFECPDDVVEKAAIRAGVIEGRNIENHYVPAQSPASGWSWRNLFSGRLAGVGAMVLVIAAVAVFVLTQRGSIEEQYSEAEIEKARQETMAAFAYVGKYTSRGATVFRDDVMAQRVVPTIRRAITTSGNEVFRGLLVPHFRPHKKDVTNDQLERFDK